MSPRLSLPCMRHICYPLGRAPPCPITIGAGSARALSSITLRVLRPLICEVAAALCEVIVALLIARLFVQALLKALRRHRQPCLIVLAKRGAHLPQQLALSPVCTRLVVPSRRYRLARARDVEGLERGNVACVAFRLLLQRRSRRAASLCEVDLRCFDGVAVLGPELVRLFLLVCLSVTALECSRPSTSRALQPP